MEDEGDGQSGERDPGEAVPGAGDYRQEPVHHAETLTALIAAARGRTCP